MEERVLERRPDVRRLFAMPGWQASEFRVALQSPLFDRADGEQPEEDVFVSTDERLRRDNSACA